MAVFEKGNQFWKQRAKHGRDMLFSDPMALWESACDYFEWCDENPFETVEYNGKDATPCPIFKLRAYTMMGLCLYLDCGKNYFEQFSKSADADFSGIITRIEQTIYTQKFEGAAAGLFSPNIIIRDLGLSDKKELSGQLSVQQITGMEIL